jgi:hypothetical protein
MALSFGRSGAAELLDLSIPEFDDLVKRGQLPNYRGSRHNPYWLLIDLRPYIRHRAACPYPTSAEHR